MKATAAYIKLQALATSPKLTAEVQYVLLQVLAITGKFIEVQGTAEGEPFDRALLDSLLDLALEFYNHRDEEGEDDGPENELQVLGLVPHLLQHRRILGRVAGRPRVRRFARPQAARASRGAAARVSQHPADPQSEGPRGPAGVGDSDRIGAQPTCASRIGPTSGPNDLWTRSSVGDQTRARATPASRPTVQPRRRGRSVPSARAEKTTPSHNQIASGSVSSTLKPETRPC